LRKADSELETLTKEKIKLSA